MKYGHLVVTGALLFCLSTGIVLAQGETTRETTTTTTTTTTETRTDYRAGDRDTTTALFGEGEIDMRSRHDKLVTRSATPVEPDDFEVALNFGYMRPVGEKKGAYDNNWARTSREHLRVYDWDLSVTMGVSPNFDVTFGAGFTDIKDRAGAFDGDTTGRGLNHVRVGGKYRFINDPDARFSMAYIPTLTAPVGPRPNSGDLRPTPNFWEFDQAIAMTKDISNWTFNTEVGYALPFGRSRHHYALPFGREIRNSRGRAYGNVGAGYMLFPYFQPVAELNYIHEFVSHGNDSDFLATTLGAVMPIWENTRLRLGVQEPITGRNSARTRTIFAAVVMGF